MTLPEALLNVWQQVPVEGAQEVILRGQSLAVRRTSRKHLIQVDYQFEGRDLRGLDQNPATPRWAKPAREGTTSGSFSPKDDMWLMWWTAR
jgi:hypothetical protein